MSLVFTPAKSMVFGIVDSKKNMQGNESSFPPIILIFWDYIYTHTRSEQYI